MQHISTLVCGFVFALIYFSFQILKGVKMKIFNRVFSLMLAVVSILFTVLSQARLSEDLPSSTNQATQRTSSLLERCIAGVTASQAELSSQAAAICGRVFSAGSTNQRVTPEVADMAHCLHVFRAFPSLTDAQRLFTCSLLFASAPDGAVEQQMEVTEDAARSTEVIF